LIITVEGYLRNKIKEEEVYGAPVTYSKVRNSYSILFGKPYQRKLLGSSSYKWMGNFEENFKTYRIYVCGLASSCENGNDST
jgi:hypothetical protein